MNCMDYDAAWSEPQVMDIKKASDVLTCFFEIDSVVYKIL